MTGVVIGILTSIAGRFLTERFFARILVDGLSYMANKSTNKLEKEVVNAVADALGVPQPEWNS